MNMLDKYPIGQQVIIIDTFEIGTVVAHYKNITLLDRYGVLLYIPGRDNVYGFNAYWQLIGGEEIKEDCRAYSLTYRTQLLLPSKVSTVTINGATIYFHEKGFNFTQYVEPGDH